MTCTGEKTTSSVQALALVLAQNGPSAYLQKTETKMRRQTGRRGEAIGAVFRVRSSGSAVDLYLSLSVLHVGGI